MTDRRMDLDAWSDDELGAALRSVGADLFPATPPLAETVSARLRTTDISGRAHAPRTRLWAVAALLAALLVGPFFFSPALREATAELFGVDGVDIEITEQEPKAELSPPDLGTESDLGSVQREVPFTIRVPSSLGAPDEVFLDDRSGESVVSLVYRPRAGLPEAAETGVGLLVMEFEGRIPGAFMKKVAGGGSTLELVDVHGRTAYWISGAPHQILYRDPEGVVRESPTRLAANTLLFSSGGVTFRIEGDIGLAQALEIARSL